MRPHQPSEPDSLPDAMRHDRTQALSPGRLAFKCFPEDEADCVQSVEVASVGGPVKPWAQLLASTR